jgi:hypothetical protein
MKEVLDTMEGKNMQEISLEEMNNIGGGAGGVSREPKYRVGSRVSSTSHPDYGTGRILAVRQKDAGVYYYVDFENHAPTVEAEGTLKPC